MLRSRAPSHSSTGAAAAKSGRASARTLTHGKQVATAAAGSRRRYAVRAARLQTARLDAALAEVNDFAFGALNAADFDAARVLGVVELEPFDVWARHKQFKNTPSGLFAAPWCGPLGALAEVSRGARPTTSGDSQSMDSSAIGPPTFLTAQTVEELGHVLLSDEWVLAFLEDLEEVVVRQEKEPREDGPLRVQVVFEALLDGIQRLHGKA